MTNSKMFFLLFFCSIFSQSAMLSMNNNSSKSQANSSFSEFLEEPMFDLERADGSIERTPINRFAHYEACKTPLNQSFRFVARTEITDVNFFVEQSTSETPVSKAENLYANLMNKPQPKQSPVTHSN